MTPLEKIKQGILKNNMQLVAEGYNSMTGDELEAQPSMEGLDLKKVQQAIQLLTSSILTETTNNLKPVAPVRAEKEDIERPITVKKKAGRKPKKKESDDSVEADDPLVNDIDINIAAGPIGGITQGKVDLRQNKISFPFAEFVDAAEQKANAQKNKEIRAQKPRLPRPKPKYIKCPKCNKNLRHESVITKYVADEKLNYYKCKCPFCASGTFYTNGSKIIDKPDTEKTED